MYEISNLTEAVLENHLDYFAGLESSHLFCSLATTPSADYLRRIMFYADKNNRSFIMFEPETGKIIGIILLNHYDGSALSMVISLLIKSNESLNADFAVSAIRPMLNIIFNDFGIKSLRSDVSDMEPHIMDILKALGFSLDAHQKEQLFYEGKYHDAYIFTLLKGDNA